MDEERLIAEQNVALRDCHTLSVRISQHPVEEFWRLQVGGIRGWMTTTVSDHESVLARLIQEAVGGEQLAWHQLAQWGQANLTRPATGFRPVLA
jgi:hypothetical protein